jgi:hypothetical protein
VGPFAAATDEFAAAGGSKEREARGGNASDIDDPAAAALNEARKYVASTTLDEVTWNNSTLLRGDVAERVAALKAEGGPDIQVRAGRRDRLQLVRLRGADRRGSGPPPQPRRRVMPRGHGRAV